MKLIQLVIFMTMICQGFAFLNKCWYDKTVGSFYKKDVKEYIHTIPSSIQSIYNYYGTDFECIVEKCGCRHASDGSNLCLTHDTWTLTDMEMARRDDIDDGWNVEYVSFNKTCNIRDYDGFIVGEELCNGLHQIIELTTKEVFENACIAMCESRPDKLRVELHPVTRRIHDDTTHASLLNGSLVEQIGNIIHVRADPEYTIQGTDFRVLSDKLLVLDGGLIKLYNKTVVEFAGSHILAVAPDESSFVAKTSSGTTLYLFDGGSVNFGDGIDAAYSPDGQHIAVLFDHITIFSLNGTQISQIDTEYTFAWGDDLITQSSLYTCTRYDIHGNELGTFICPGNIWRVNAYKDFVFFGGTKFSSLFKNGTEIYLRSVGARHHYFKDDKLYFTDETSDELVELDLSPYSPYIEPPMSKEALIQTYQDNYC